MELEGRVAVITGANGQIGSAVARLFADQGARLCLADISAEPPARIAAEAIYVRTDVTREADVGALIDTASRTFGRLDILVNVAGVTAFGSAETLARAEWDRVLAINLTGTFLCCQAAIPVMRRNKYGRILNLGSVVGKNGGNARPWVDPAEQEQAANVAYGVSKAGVHAMTLFLARECAGHGITVNAVAPGPIRSPMTTNFPKRLRALIPMGRVGEADEVARACLFLASEHAGFITAEILDVNGGIWGD